MTSALSCERTNESIDFMTRGRVLVVATGGSNYLSNLTSLSWDVFLYTFYNSYCLYCFTADSGDVIVSVRRVRHRVFGIRTSGLSAYFLPFFFVLHRFKWLQSDVTSTC